jgi:hypothetical protein
MPDLRQIPRAKNKNQEAWKILFIIQLGPCFCPAQLFLSGMQDAVKQQLKVGAGDLRVQDSCSVMPVIFFFLNKL